VAITYSRAIQPGLLQHAIRTHRSKLITLRRADLGNRTTQAQARGAGTAAVGGKGARNTASMLRMPAPKAPAFHPEGTRDD
jgi:hypothetical protein